MYKNKVKFKGIRNCIRVPVRQFDNGCSRAAFNCDYVRDGKKYIVKHALRKDRGKAINRFEFHIYQHAKHTKFKKFYPDFRAISKDGEWLLVEKCITARDEQNRKGGLYVDATKIFPYFMQTDLSSTNWGYTIKDKRPVMFDLGYCSSALSHSAREVGVPDETIKELNDDY